MTRTENERRARLRDILRRDACRMALLERVEALGLPDCWIAAGFVRAAVWDELHGRPAAPPDGDIDVIRFDAAQASETEDRAIEMRLSAAAPAFLWSVKNQARMHLRNSDAPYASCEDAMRHWPETATSVAVRRSAGGLDVVAPYGLEDLFGLVLRPPPEATPARRTIFRQRVAEKRWLERWPGLRIPDEAYPNE